MSAPARSNGDGGIPSGVTWRTALELLMPHGWPTMVTERAQADLSTIAGALPVELTRAFYGEVRLSGDDDQTDVSLEIARTERAAWRHWIDAQAMSASLAPDADAWRAISRLLVLWENDRALDVAIRELWIEFDRPSGCRVSAPSCFIGFHTTRPVSAAVVVRCAMSLVPGLSVARRARLRASVQALPASVALGQLGVLLAREDGAPMRLCLAGVQAGALDALCQRLGVPGAHPQHALQSLRAGCGRAETAPILDYVDLDVTEHVLPRVGLELRCDRREQARGVLGERAWLHRLASVELVSAQWIDALAAWPQGMRVVLPHQFWPSLALRRLNHIKLLWEYGRLCSAKGYCLLRVVDAPPRRTPAVPSVPTSVARHRSFPVNRSRDVRATVPS